MHNSSTVRRPWGFYQVLLEGKAYLVKEIHVSPLEILSLQYHRHRSENWVVIEGTAVVTLDKEVITLEPSQNIFIPKKTVHRVSNPSGTKVLKIIEVQIGEHLAEDDIVRLQDKYNRT
jgi:mannose-6-phosphate isomerase-like protein (cupin superfamily)